MVDENEYTKLLTEVNFTGNGNHYIDDQKASAENSR